MMLRMFTYNLQARNQDFNEFYDFSPEAIEVFAPTLWNFEIFLRVDARVGSKGLYIVFVEAGISITSMSRSF